MKLADMVNANVARYLESGMPPRYMICTARFLDLLLKEVHDDGSAALSRLAMSAGDNPTTYMDMEVVVADLPSTHPIMVSGNVQDQLALYSMRPKPPG